jgi:pimeloyl-ACP methyl ester carboxylesterase
VCLLLEELVTNWPVPVERISLVGHSLGGLIARSACHQGTEANMRWSGLVRETVSLGTPHLGAPLEKGVHVAAAALSAVPETRPFGGFLRRRSAGIRDLRHGCLVDEDWRDRDPEALRSAALTEIPLHDGATHYFIAATLTRDQRHPLGRLFGDLLVLPASAAGRSRARSVPFDLSNGRHVGGAHHFSLLNHPDIYGQLRSWLKPPGVLSAGESLS